MVSFTYLLSVITLLACVVLAEDVANQKSDSSDEKWYWGTQYGSLMRTGWYGAGWGVTSLYGVNPWLARYGGFSALGYFPYTYPTWFSKEAETASNNARRSHVFEPEQYSRRNEASVTCKGKDGKSVEFVPQECIKAATLMVSQKASQQTCGKCQLKLVSPEGPVAANGIPAEVLAKATEKILNSCSNPSSNEATPAQAPAHNGRRSPADASNANRGQQVALLVLQGQGPSC